MIQVDKVKPATEFIMKELGYTWDKCFDELAPMSSEKVDEVFMITESLYSMYSYSAGMAIERNLWADFGITNPKLIEVIKKEWETDHHRHVWGRFDFAGGTSGKPLKLIEFNADTATAIVETSVLQYAVAQTNGGVYNNQFNDVYESMINSFKDLKRTWGLVEDISAVAISLDTEEDTRTIQYIAECAGVAGIDIDFIPMDKLYFDKEQGIFISEDGERITKKYNLMIKLIPWEMILEEEPEYADIIMDLILNDDLVVINPAYTLLFQSKYMLKFLYDLYPTHPNIIECYSDKSKINSKEKWVSKPIFGREGANVTIMDGENIICEEDGDYANQPMIYQKYVEMDTDSQGRTYQIGSFMCNEACGIAFRRSDTKIIVNTSEFVGHYIK